MRITVDVEKCCGAGQCVRSAPEIFAQRDSDGLVLLRGTQPPRALWNDVREAADLCPGRAISIHE